MGARCLRNRQRPRPAQSGATPSAAPSLGSTRVHAEVVGDLGNWGAVRGDRLHPRPRPASVGPARCAAARRGPRVGRRRTGTVAPELIPGPEPRAGPKDHVV